MNRKKFLSAVLASLMLVSLVPTLTANEIAYAASDSEEELYVVRFDLGGGTIDNITSDVTFKVKKGSKYKELKVDTPEREGYTFRGWFDKQGQEMEPDFVFRENTKIEAKWDKIEEKVVNPELNFNIKFKDVNNNAWYAKGVSYVVQNKIMKGVSEDEFAPNKNLTRAMVVTILHNMEDNRRANVESNFDDVYAGIWYKHAVDWAAERKIIPGIVDNEFFPNRDVTREEFVTFMYNYTKAKNKLKLPKTTPIDKFSDANKVSKDAVSPMNWAVENGILSGSDGKLMPQGKCTRAQIATIIENYCTKFE